MTSPLDVVPEDVTSPDDLREEFERVRETLRSNLVPEAWKLGTLQRPEELKEEAPLLWLLACGTYHDHMAFAAVAAALKHAGYRVQVFGVASSARLFSSLGIPFEAHDAFVLLHRNNPKGRTWLQMLSTELGFEGPDKEADFLLDLHLLRAEFSIGISLKAAFEGNITEFTTVGATTQIKFNDLFHRSECTEEFSKYVRDRYSDVIAWRAQERRMSVENFTPVRRARTKAFRDFLRQKAREEGCDPIDLIEALRSELVKLTTPKVAQAAKDGKDLASLMMSEVMDFLGWLGGKIPRDWWEDWSVKLEGWRDSLPTVRVSQSWVPSAMANLKFTLQTLEKRDHPAMVLYRWDMASVALMLEAECKCKTCLLWPFRAAPSPYVHLGLYCGLVLQERGEPLPCTPVSNMGPLAFSDRMWGRTQIIGASPLSLKDDLVPAELRSCPVTLKAIRERMTGQWCLDSEPTFLAPDDLLFFGSEGERQRAFEFLADSSDPPVCMSWGRHRHPKCPADLAKLVARCLQLLGRRGVFIVGSSGASLHHLQTDRNTAEDIELAAFAERQILFLSIAPHNWLFPRCTCVAHHGGPGTTQSALRCGVPQAIIKSEWPFSSTGKLSMDLVRSLGCGVEGLPLQQVTPESLAGTLRLLLGDTSIRAQVAEVAKSMQRQPGVLGAVPLVSHLLQEREPPPSETSAKANVPWRDGLWAFHHNGTMIARGIVHGEDWCNENGHRTGWVRHGSFRLNDMSKLPAGHSLYTVQGWFPDVARLSYGIVSSDGRKITWDAPNTFHIWEADAPLPGKALLPVSPLGLLARMLGKFTVASQEED